MSLFSGIKKPRIPDSFFSSNSLERSNYFESDMADGKLFSPSIHRRYLPVQYLGMVAHNHLLTASPRRFTWLIRRWLAQEVTNIYRMDGWEREIRASFLGKKILTYLLNQDNIDKYLQKGRNLGCRGAFEWVYLVPESWIKENFFELYNAYLAEGCYYTITSLNAFGKLSNGTELNAVTSKGERVSLSLSSDVVYSKEIFSVIKVLKTDKVFRDSLSKDCLGKLKLFYVKNSYDKDYYSYGMLGRFLKNEEGALEKFYNLYLDKTDTKCIDRSLLSSYGVPTVGLTFEEITFKNRGYAESSDRKELYSSKLYKEALKNHEPLKYLYVE